MIIKKKCSHSVIFVVPLNTCLHFYVFFFLNDDFREFIFFHIFMRRNFLLFFLKKKGEKKTLLNKFHLPKTKTERKSFIYFFIYLQSIRVGKIWLYLENSWILLKVIFLTSV